MSFWDDCEEFAVEGNSFKTFKEGEYGAVIEDAKLDLSSEPNKVEFVFKFSRSA